MLTDIWIRKYPGNLLSGLIQISEYPFNYASVWLLIVYIYVFTQFFEIFMLVVGQYKYNPKYGRLDLNVLYH